MAKSPTTTAPSITLNIDGRDVGATAGQTILEVARENGIRIPALCYVEGLSIWGGCRLCVVEIVGSNKLLPACATDCAQDMQVVTDSPRLRHYRRTVLELLFTEGNHICAVCVSNGHCELQTMAQNLGITHIHVPYRYPHKQVDSSHDRFRMDHNRCILCTRCVRVCDEIESAHTKDVKGRGIDARIINDLDEPWGDSETCTSCGKCVHVCPVGALVEKTTAAGEMSKQRTFLPYLTTMRESRS
ncbi:MAG: bidirectional hydrogenase complex protein HoxU [Planctomycetes bacterium]|jgi:bidirectional [NiFe] hydrogenase diaphorase subunit|nr:bidirectional hydrogenase complex protein HoxU [Planctomycetota bacterium]